MKQIFYASTNSKIIQWRLKRRKRFLLPFENCRASRLILQKLHLHVGVDHLVEMNFAGSVLVERTKEDWGNKITANTTGSTHAAIDHPPPPIPLSVWPKVLERAWKEHPRISNNFCTGNNRIHYLLRNKLALLQEGETRN